MQLEGDLDEPPPERRQQRQTRFDQLFDLVEGVAARNGGWVEHRRRRHVHVVVRCLQVQERGIETAQALHANSFPYFRRRLRRRSASGLPPVWQVAQYCNEEVE